MNKELTTIEKEILEDYLRTNNQRQTARNLGKSRNSIQQALKRIERKGLAPWFTGAVTPEHLECGKTTVQYGPDGEVEREWKRLYPTHQAMQDFVYALCEQAKGKGKAAPRRPRKTDSEDILGEIDIYDAHVGMYADERETLDSDYNCEIAAQRMVEAAEGLAGRMGRPHKIVVVFGGDMQHADNRSNKTEASGNVLDVDTRYQRVVEYLIKASTDVIQIAAATAAQVEVVVVRGNHSWHSEVWLAQVLNAYYSNCPNVNVRVNKSPRHIMTFGANMLVWAHGDRIPMNKWAQVIPAEFPVEWGATRHRHLKLGHIHHKRAIAPVVVDEQCGLMVEFLEALCPTDAWHAGSGYVGSQKGASGFEYHREHGLMTRFFQVV